MAAQYTTERAGRTAHLLGQIPQEFTLSTPFSARLFTSLAALLLVVSGPVSAESKPDRRLTGWVKKQYG